MKMAMTVALATAVGAGGFALLAQPASAAIEFPDGKECSKAEYQRIERGTTEGQGGTDRGQPRQSRGRRRHEHDVPVRWQGRRGWLLHQGQDFHQQGG